jgi:hypothetical protein
MPPKYRRFRLFNMGPDATTLPLHKPGVATDPCQAVVSGAGDRLCITAQLIDADHRAAAERFQVIGRSKTFESV